MVTTNLRLDAGDCRMASFSDWLNEAICGNTMKTVVTNGYQGEPL